MGWFEVPQRGTTIINRGYTYATSAKDFALQNIQYECGETHHLKAQSASILLVMKGQLNLRSETTALSLKQGEVAFITAQVRLMKWKD